MTVVTLSKGRERENEGSHAHWHVNIQADGIFSRPYIASLTNLEHTSDTKLIFRFGLKAVAEFVRGPDWLEGPSASTPTVTGALLN